MRGIKLSCTALCIKKRDWYEGYLKTLTSLALHSISQLSGLIQKVWYYNIYYSRVIIIETAASWTG